MAERLNKSLLYTFGVGDLFFALMINMELYFFPAFLTDYAQFSLGVVGRILYVTSFADIVCALVAGVILQKVALTFGGRYRSWLLIGPPIVAPLFILQFTKIGNVSVAAWIIIVGFIASHLLFNVVYAATGSMVGSLSQRPNERTILSSSRAQGMAAAGLIFSATALPMITYFGKRTDTVVGFSIAVAIYCVLMVLGHWYVYKISAAASADSDRAAPVVQKQDRPSVGQMVALVFKNPPLLVLIVVETFRNTCMFMITSFAFYYFGYVLKNSAFLSIFILAISLAALFGTFAAAWIGVKIGKRHCYGITLVLATFIFISAAMAGKATWGFTIIFCIANMLVMIAGSMTTALFADTAVYGEWKTSRDIQAFIMSLLVLPIKVGVLFRSAVITMGLMAIGFVANTVPTERVVSGISSIMIFSPAIASAIAAVIFYFGYRIEDKDVLKMQNEIAGRAKINP